VNAGRFCESAVEEAALAWLAELGWAVKSGPDISPDGDTLTPALSRWERVTKGRVRGASRWERGSYGEVVLLGRFWNALQRLNEGGWTEVRGQRFEEGGVRNEE